MLSKKDFRTAVLVAFCIFLNFIGNYTAANLHLPLWLDSIGTAISSYILGAVCGSIVGITVNVVYTGFSSMSCIYSISSIAIAVTVSFAAKRKWFHSFYGTISASIIVTLVSVVFSVSMSHVFSDGYTNNIWGDAVIDYLSEQGLPFFPSSVIGQFYIDFVDKVLTLLIVFAGVRIWHRRRKIKRTLEKSAKKIVEFSFLLSLLCLSSQKSSAQSAVSKNKDFNSYVQTVYSSENGIPCGEANDIAQTPDGILWIGTYAGLYRYNGSEFRWMKDFDTVRSVNCLYVDEEGRLWIGTNDNGLSICINEKIIKTLSCDDGLPSNSVRSIVKGEDGYYYVGTSIGILVLELNSGLRICNIIKDAGYTSSLSASKDGFVAAVSSKGQLFVLNDTEIRYSQTLGIKGENFTCCAFDENGILYAGTSRNQVFRYKITEEKATLIGTGVCEGLKYLKKIYFDNDRIFTCSDSGIGYFVRESEILKAPDYTGDFEFRKINTGSFDNSIDNMTVDYQGNYWFTSSRKGLLRLSASSFVNLYGSLAIPSKVVNSVTMWNGVLYVGTDTGLDAVNIPNRLVVNNFLTNALSGVRIRCIKTDSKNHLWLSTYGKGLVEASENGKITYYEEIGSRIRVSTELKDGTIVAAGIQGISFIKNQKVVKKLTQAEGLSSAMTLTLMEMNDGTLLAGTDGDGIMLIKDEKIEKILTISDGLTSGVILRTINSSLENGAFIVTSNSLCYMEKDFSVRPLKNFPYFNNYDIQKNCSSSLPDGQENLFVLGSAGIYVVNESALLHDSPKIQYDLLDSKSGLNASLTANAWNYSDEEGHLFLSTDRGVFVVDMNNYIFGKLSYHMMVSGIKLDSQLFQIERTEPFTIGRNISKIEIFPEVVNYTVLDPYVSYWLEGFEENETLIPQSQLSTVVYTNLPSGKYTFHLSFFDKEQNVVEENRYEIIKEQELHDTKIFMVYLVLVAMLAIAWITWFFVRNHLQKRFDLQRRQLEFVQNQVKMGNETILAIAKTVDAKDENTSQHSMRVSEYSVLLARELGFSEAELENLRKAALLHDIGKIGIPDSILNKPGRLNDEEYAVMKSHVTRGAAILKDFTMIEHVQEGVLYHHEKYDGTGYPQGLKGEAIPLYGRIIGVADAFDAMTANRVYRKQLDFNYVLEELKRCRGTQFDPKIADIMLRLVSEGKIDVAALYNKSKNE
ncbi:MAG: HD domain-containing protein [Treponema sp.]|nr:HD domain-containing protein [Treponema sp.]